MTEIEQKRRIRINYSCSVKGVVTPEVTIEDYDKPKEEVLKEATELMTQALKEAERLSKND